MKAFFRDWLGTLQALVQVLAIIAERLQDRSGEQLDKRVQALEHSRALLEGEVAGALVKVEARFNAARAVEERVRSRARTRGGVDDEEADFGPEAEQQLAFVPPQHAPGSREGAVPPVREALAGDPRSQIRARKWGRS